SHALLEAVRPLFESEGFVLAWGAPTRWYVAHESLSQLPTASLDRVIGRGIDLWMPDHPQARLLQRLQNEVQMLLHDDPVNRQREARGLPPVNSFWLSGCGRHQPGAPEADLQVDSSLRSALLAGDWPAWAQAWRALDSGAIAQ